MKSTVKSRCATTAAMIGLGLCMSSSAFATDIQSILGSAGSSYFGVVNLSGNFQFNSDGSSNGDTMTGVGNVGLVSGSSTSISGGSSTTSTGTLYLGPGVSSNNINAVFAGGVVTNDQRLTTSGVVVTDVSNAFSTFNGMAVDQTLGNVNGTTTVNATHSGINVIDVSSISLSNGKSFTVNSNGYSNVQFVVNVTGDIQLSGGGLLTAGSLANTDVLYNVAGKVQSSGGGIMTDDGIILSEGQQVAWDGVQLDGEIIGNNVAIVSGGRVDDNYSNVYGGNGGGGGTNTPEPGTLTMLMGAGASSLGMFFRRRRQSA